MKKRIFPSEQYKKDYKRYRHQSKKIEALAVVIDMLANDIPIPAEYYPHPLHGNYEGCIECHIQGDFLLIWIDKENNIIELDDLARTRNCLENK